jgi:CO dehydrogenase/acetyl-CoA synthase beta subunit
LEIFDDDIRWLRGYLESRRSQGRDVRLLDSGERDRRIPDFFNKEKTAIVLSEDTWLELGNPKTNSTAPVLVTESLDLVHDGAITLVGPDVPEIRGSLPFAQILLIASDQLQEEDYRKINSFQYELELRGYMIKAIPSSLTIWSRVSVESARGGFSFGGLGDAIIESYKRRFRISAMEVLFVTSSPEDVDAFDGLRGKVTRITSAMNKMMEELSFDCSSCEYLDVCGDVRQLGALREKLLREREARARSGSAPRPDPD